MIIPVGAVDYRTVFHDPCGGEDYHYWLVDYWGRVEATVVINKYGEVVYHKNTSSYVGVVTAILATVAIQSGKHVKIKLDDVSVGILMMEWFLGCDVELIDGYIYIFPYFKPCKHPSLLHDRHPHNNLKPPPTFLVPTMYIARKGKHP